MPPESSVQATQLFQVVKRMAENSGYRVSIRTSGISSSAEGQIDFSWDPFPRIIIRRYDDDPLKMLTILAHEYFGHHMQLKDIAILKDKKNNKNNHVPHALRGLSNAEINGFWRHLTDNRRTKSKTELKYVALCEIDASRRGYNEIERLCEALNCKDSIMGEIDERIKNPKAIKDFDKQLLAELDCHSVKRWLLVEWARSYGLNKDLLEELKKAKKVY